MPSYNLYCACNIVQGAGHFLPCNCRLLWQPIFPLSRQERRQCLLYQIGCLAKGMGNSSLFSGGSLFCCAIAMQCSPVAYAPSHMPQLPPPPPPPLLHSSRESPVPQPEPVREQVLFAAWHIWNVLFWIGVGPALLLLIASSAI